MSGLGRETILIYLLGTALTFLAGILVTWVSLKRNWAAPKLLVALGLGMPIYLLAAQFLKMYSFKNYADFTVWHQIFQNLAQGNGPWSSLQEGLIPESGHWFSAHFTPLLYIVAPVYWAIPKAETIIVMQFILLYMALPILYRYAKGILQSRGHALAIAALLAIYPTYQYIHLYEFEMLRFSIPLLLLTFSAIERGPAWRYWLFLALSLLVREEVAITTFFLGGYIVVFQKERRWTGISTAVVSLIYFLVVTQAIMPYFRSGSSMEHVAAFWFASLGKTMPEAIIGIFTKPAVVFALISDPVKLANLFMYGLPLLGIPLRCWPILLIACGNVGLNLLSGSPTHTSYFLYYLSPSIPFVFIALIKGVASLGQWLDGRRGLSPQTREKSPGIAALLCGLLAAAWTGNLFFGPSPLSFQFWFESYRLAPFRTQNFHFRHYLITDHHRLAAKIIELVPRDAVVSTEQALLPAFYDRNGLKVFPDLEGADYAVIDKKNPLKTGTAKIPGSWDGLRQNPQRYYDMMEKRPAEWTLIHSEDGYAVFQHRSWAN